VERRRRAALTELAEVQRVINRRVSGDAAIDPYQYFLSAYLADHLPVRNALTIGCGGGDLERGLSQYGFATRHDALDVAPGAIEKAIASAEAAGLRQIRYSVADGNVLTRADLVRRRLRCSLIQSHREAREPVRESLGP
jgi:2-polyprenyl-3-methyl-5-hydroxy-6-metoxy-1,4-benzoquinol methylase